MGGARDGVSMHRLLASRAQGARAGRALCAGGEEEVCRVACLLAARHTCGPSASPSAPIGPRALYDRHSSGGSCAQLKPQLKPQQLSRTRDGGGSRDRTTIPTRRVHRDLRQMDNARHGGAISLVWPTGRELHRTGECAPLTFSEVLRYLPTIGAPESVITDLASKDKPPPFNVLEEIAQEYGGTLKDVGHLRDQLAEREIEKEAEDRAMRHGHFGPSVEAPPLVAHLHNDVVNRARDVTIEKEQVSTAGGRRGSIHKQSAAQIEDVDKTVDDAHANNTLAAAMAVSSQAKRHDSRERKRGGRNSIMRKSVVATESPRVNSVPHTPLDRHESKGSALGAGGGSSAEVRAEPRCASQLFW